MGKLQFATAGHRRENKKNVTLVKSQVKTSNPNNPSNIQNVAFVIISNHQTKVQTFCCICCISEIMPVLCVVLFAKWLKSAYQLCPGLVDNSAEYQPHSLNPCGDAS